MNLRDAGPTDGKALTDALLSAANWDDQERFTREQLLADPHLSGKHPRDRTAPISRSDFDVGGVCHAADMTVQRSSARVGPFWDFIAGRAPTPPAAATLGMKVISVDVDPAEFEATFQALPEFLNPAGSVQGGFLAAMLDDTMGPALAATLAPDEFAPTLELKVSFLRPAKPGTLTGRGRVVHRGSRVAFLAGELLDDTGSIVATASATARVAKHDWIADR